MIHLNIRTADDSGRSHSTTIDVDGENMTYQVSSSYGWYRRSSVLQGTTINPNHFRQATEPTIKGITQWLNNWLGWGKKGRPTFSGFVLIRGAKIHVTKHGNKYLIQGMVTTKDTAITALARTVYRSCFEEDAKVLETYCFNNVLLPENVSYALENRAPYHWYLKGKKVDVRFNVQMIGPDECALEISDGVWAPIAIKKLNTYMNYYHKGLKSSSWYKARLTPKKLWTRLLKTEPTPAQEHMMIEFLQQNRTDELVQKRAYQLVKEMSKQYENRIRVFWDGETVKAMLVRGILADWVITDNQFKSDIQAVSTYLYEGGESEYRSRQFLVGSLKGPICIDNLTKHSSVGDQFAARAFALLNDKMTVALVSTINHYLSKEHYDGQTEHRIKFDEVTHDEITKICNGQN